MGWHKNKERRESVLSKGESDLFIRKNNYKLLFRHSCPLCRKVSLNMIPSKHFLTGQQKETYIQQYKEERRARVCCNSFASCQFKDECYYQHRDQEEESFTHVNRRPFLSTEIPPYATVEDNSSASYSFWNDISFDNEPSDTDLRLGDSIPEDNEEPNILKSVMGALAFAKAHEDSSNVEEPRSLPSWLR